jgi:hypothetical protein
MPVVRSSPDIHPEGRFRLVTDAREWDALVARCTDRSVVATSAYLAAGAMLEPDGKPELAIYRDRDGTIIHPYVNRAIDAKGTWRDLISAYEFGGYWYTTRDAAKRARLTANFDRLFRQHCMEHAVVSEFMRLHPMLFRNPALFGDFDLGGPAEHVIVPLLGDPDRLRSGYHVTRRRQVRQGHANGLVMEPIRDAAAFIDVYHENLNRLEADDFWYFPADYIAALGDMLRIFLVRDPKGEVCGAHCYLDDAPWRFAFLCHGVAAKLDLRPNDFAFDAAMVEAQADGLEWLHLGGGQPSLLAYKSKFSNVTVPYRWAKRVFLPDVYGQLVAAREGRTGVSLAGNGFFPLYRAPGAPD